MEQFKRKLKIRIRLLSAFSLIAVLLVVYNVFFAPETLKNMDVFEFQTGFITAICILSALNSAKYSKLLNNETKLKLEYNKENDERFKLIKSKAGVPLIIVLSSLMMIVGVIAGYFNLVVFYTLIIAAMCQVLVSGIIKIIYMKKM